MKKLIIILLIFQPLVNRITLKSGGAFDVYNELISLMIFSLYLFQVLKRGKISSISVVFYFLVFYMLILAFLRDIYPLSFFQIAIYSQWFFYFLYFNNLTSKEKYEFIFDLKKLFDKVLILIIIISFFELIFYKQFRGFLGIPNLSRGIGGFYLTSFFGSGASFAHFISLYIFVWFYYYYGYTNEITKNAKLKIWLAFLVLILTFSRKEVLLVFLFFLFFPFQYKTQIIKWVRKVLVFGGIALGMLIYYFSFFSHANKVAFSDKYVRWMIAEKSHEILMDNFPWGSGAGTFGSRVSLMMKDVVYEKYDVGPQMLGYEVLGQTRGPIYDAFLFTFTAEIGIGILIYLFFFFKIFEAKTIERNSYKSYIKNYLVVYFFILSFLQPILMSSFGYLCAIFMGITIGNISLLKFRIKYAKI